MNTDTELTFSNDLCAAFLTAIVKSHQSRHPGHFLGRTAVQKLTYFTQVLGAPIPCSFDIYTYGPYSDTVAFTVDSLLADASQNSKYSNYRPARNADYLLDLYAEDIRPYQDVIDRVVESLGAFRPNDLELIATLHFVARRQRQRTGKLVKPCVVDEFKSIKKNKFTDQQIDGWYNALASATLI
jgi:uncharacterized protein